MLHLIMVTMAPAAVSIQVHADQGEYYNEREGRHKYLSGCLGVAASDTMLCR